MNKFRLFGCYIASLAAVFLLLPVKIQAIERDEVYISKAELYEVLDNIDMKYVYLGTDFSDLYEVVSQINDLEDNKDSMLLSLRQHIEEGCSIGLYDSVVEALVYAEKVLQENCSKINPEKAQDISRSLDIVINQVVNEILNIDATKITSFAELDAMIDSSDTGMRCPVGPQACCPPVLCNSIKVRKKLDVFADARFRKDVEIDGKLKVYGKAKFEDKVKFEEDVVFEEDVTIEGTLTVTDLVVTECINNLCVENLTVIDIIVPGGSCLSSLCVNNLSVTNETITGTLSANNAIIQTLSAVEASIDTLSVTDLVATNEMVTNLSATNETVTNLSVTNAVITNLSVVGCLANLCVNNLSVVNESISGTLSVNNEIVTNLTATNLSATDAFIEFLSVVDETITGTSSINDAIINNATITNLSATNAVIGNLSVTGCVANLCVDNLSVVNESVSGTLSVANEVVANLTVTNCINSLCVIDLSVVNESVSGTLSVSEIVAASLSTCDVIVGCDIKMNNTLGLAVGNILKNNVLFMHNAGVENTFLGANAGNVTTLGADNVGLGFQTLFLNTTGNNNNTVGAFALGTNTIGADNNAMGVFALASNTTGNENVAIGSNTLISNTSGSGNTAIGFDAGYSLATGNNNVFVGNNAGLFTATGFTNVIIGYNSGLSLTTGSNNIYIANAGVASENGIIRIGTVATHTEAFVQGIFGSVVGGTGIPVYVDASGRLGTVVSARKFKHDIEDMKADFSENIYNLRPVSFVYNADETNTQQYGLIAEEVDQVLPELVVHDENGAPFTVRYHLLPMLLLNEVQKLREVVQDQAVTISALKADNKKISQLMETVLARIN